jgi:ferredoxin
MKVTVDKTACNGHARCYAAAPEVYDIDDDGFNVVDEAVVPAELESSARAGAEACPEYAITIEP